MDKENLLRHRVGCDLEAGGLGPFRDRPGKTRMLLAERGDIGDRIEKKRHVEVDVGNDVLYRHGRRVVHEVVSTPLAANLDTLSQPAEPPKARELKIL